jgi:hypothetical protein
MTRKDYILIANALRIPYTSFENKPSYSRELSGVECAAIAITDALAEDNPKFNREHFLAVVHGERDINSRPDRFNPL